MTQNLSLGGKGFNSILKSDLWQIASITYDTQYSPEGFDHMKRHLTSDEAFVLLKGTATLHTYEDNQLVSTPLSVGKVACVGKGTWHYLCVSEDALVAVSENADLLPKDTERIELECLMQK